MRDKFSVYFKQLASEWPRFYRLNHYYHRNLQKLAQFLIPEDIQPTYILLIRK